MDPKKILRDNNPFCSNSAPQPWGNNDYDVPSICAGPFDNLFKLVKAKSENPELPIGILIKGENGSGKTHLLARILKKCSDEKVNAFFVSIIPIFASSKPMDHLNREIITSLGKNIPGRPRYTQIHRLITEVLREYVSKENGIPNINQKIEDNQWFFFLPQKDKQAEAQILADNAIAWLVGEEVRVSNDFLRALFAYCNDLKRHIARKWLYGERLDEKESKEIGVTYHAKKIAEDVHEQIMFDRILSITALAARYHLTIIICFDQLEDLSSENQRTAFGQMIQTLVNFCPGTLPVVLSRMRYWDTGLKPFLNTSVIERVEMNSFAIMGCSPDQVDEILQGRIKSKFPEKWIELYNWLSNELKKNLFQNNIGTLSPREVIIKANKIILNNQQIKKVNPLDILSLKFKEATEELRCLEPTKWSLSKEQLLSATSLYFKGIGWHVTTSTDSKKYIKISNKNEKAVILINTESNYQTVGGYFTEGIKLINKNKDQFCIIIADPRCTLSKKSWIATGKKQKEFANKGGYVYSPHYADICRFYALDNLRRNVVVGDITYETLDGSRNVTLEDLNLFIKTPEKFGEVLLSIPPKNIPLPPQCDHIKNVLTDLLRTGPSFIADIDYIHKELIKTFPISLDSLIDCCKSHEDDFKLIPTGSGLTIMLYGSSATC
nr:P-loop NTPase fold protein [uncultured Methanospirillum sp.]